MNMSIYIDKFIKKSNTIHEKAAPVLLSLVGLAFLLSDFRYNGFTFADFLLMFMMLILFLSGQMRLTCKQGMIIAIIVSILIVNMVSSIKFNPDIIQRNLMTQSIKLSFYLITMMVLYNYIDRFNLRKSFLTINKVIAYASIVIGIYITLALYTGGELPYEFLWRFTRSHPTSYEFQGNPNIIRTRSLFSEPAHFGFYLNVILASILFNVQHYKKRLVDVVILVAGILTTLSYSMVGIMLILLTYYSLAYVKEKKIRWSIRHTIIVGVIIVGLFIFWDYLYITLIERTLNILGGNDSSVTNRLFNSWQYVADQSLIYGNGISHTPTITNNFAYMLSDFGLIGFIPFILFTIYMLYVNVPFGLTFVMLNFSRGGYLAAPFWIVLLFYFLYSLKGNNREGNLFMRR